MNEKEFLGSEFNETEDLFWGDEESNFEIFEDLDLNQNFN